MISDASTEKERYASFHFSFAVVNRNDEYVLEILLLQNRKQKSCFFPLIFASSFDVSVISTKEIIF